jgi:uncharacterized membrane protein YqaE (UPF0057 family)
VAPPSSGATHLEQRPDWDVWAIVSLILAIILPPIGALLAVVTMRRPPGRGTDLRIVAIVVGIALTIFGFMLGVWAAVT